MHRARLGLAACLAALLAVSSGFAQSDTSMNSDQQSSDLKTDKDVQQLSPFEVTSTKDRGYLKTNSSTATRIGTEIQKVPMTISVISQEFMQDTDLQSLNDVFRYMASAAGDQQFASDRPSNAPTPQGNQRLRGFPVNVILRNGVFMYSTKDVTDFTDRIEVIKGPAAVFFGQGYPGGVINYITKKAEFAKIPTTLRYTFGADNRNRVILDTNQVLSDKAALRIVGGWVNSKGQQKFEFTKRFDVDTTLALKPFNNDKLKIMFEAIYYEQQQNDAGKYSWFFPDAYFSSYNNPTAAQIAAAGVTTADAYRALIVKNLGAWRNYERIARGDPSYPLYVSNKRGAFYTDANGNYIHDTGFNMNNRGSVIHNQQTTTALTVEASPFSWLDIRYNYTMDYTKFMDTEGYWYPSADQMHFRIVGQNGSGYYRKTWTHQVDFVFHYDTGSLKHKLLAGYLYDDWWQNYMTPKQNNIPDYTLIPGFNYPAYQTSGYGLVPKAANGNHWVPVNQVVRDRYGNIKTPEQIYMDYDPGTEIQPPVDRIIDIYNALVLDGYRSSDAQWYVNYQLTALDDRLTAMAGFRSQTAHSGGQWAVTNFPWYAPPATAGFDTVTYPPDAYNYSQSYALSNLAPPDTGRSFQIGVSYEIIKDVNIYATYSKTFQYNGHIELGYYGPYTPNLTGLITDTLNAYAAAGQPLIYTFADGSTRLLTTVDGAMQALTDDGAFRHAKNESGLNREIGVKTSLWDGRLTSTVSVYQADRINQRKEDGYHQSLEIFNFNYPEHRTINGVPIAVPDTARHFRWYSNDAHDRTQGLEFDVIWQPTRNFQSVTNGSWMWEADHVTDPTVQPGNANYAIYWGSRLPGSPEYRFNTFNKYTFVDGPVRGLSVGLGMRYASKIVISQSPDWNPLTNGYQAGDYVVFDATLGYPYEIFGYKLKSELGVYNLTDKVYSDGWYSLAPARYWILSTTMSF
jgi:outer membrane receptor protein involved in Fe transport